MNANERTVDPQAPAYRRDLPGGGFVIIQVDASELADATPRTRVWVERRGTRERRLGHVPPIIAEVDGDESSPHFGDIYKMASDNASIARALMRLPEATG